MKLHNPMGARIGCTGLGLLRMGPVTSAICLYSAEKLITHSNMKSCLRKWSSTTPLRIMAKAFIVYRLFEHMWSEVLEDVLEDVS